MNAANPAAPAAAPSTASPREPAKPLSAQSIAAFAGVELPPLREPPQVRSVADAEAGTVYQLSFTLPAADADAWAARYASIFGREKSEVAAERRASFGITAPSVRPERGGDSARPGHYSIVRQVFVTYPDASTAHVHLATWRMPR